MKTYTPNPIDTSAISLPSELAPVVERLAEHVHDKWAQERIAQGWTLGPERNDQRKEHPSLVPYNELPELEKVFDRSTATESLKAVLAMGWRIERK